MKKMSLGLMFHTIKGVCFVHWMHNSILLWYYVVK